MWENKFKAQTSAGKIMASVCDNDGIVLVGFMERGGTSNAV
jgi:hypothetical protein